MSHAACHTHSQPTQPGMQCRGKLRCQQGRSCQIPDFPVQLVHYIAGAISVCVHVIPIAVFAATLPDVRGSLST